ncbi:MAG: MarR family winged helix-turn-helix transcriptional regulator [Corynebacterium casei]|uniref:MarR family winged helix-turn-helix transcriptional regulator n=2 Tax=Corynebacterium casei TaxID=160386 RepID=UPI003BB70234
MEQPRMNLETVIGYKLKQAQSALRARMDGALRPLQLTTPQYSCLEVIRDNPGASSAEIARRAFVSRQTMNTLLRGLQSRGLVERGEASNSRALPTTLTREGLRLLEEASTVVSQINHSLTATLTEEQREQLSAALSQCFEALNQSDS